MLKQLGLTLAGVWLLATGLIDLLHVRFEYRDLVMAGLAVIAGLLLIVQR
ncbi:MAG: hypothetical protein P8011_03755 [Acidihalobacter sp.]|jgi:hypothetical protein